MLNFQQVTSQLAKDKVTTILAVREGLEQCCRYWITEYSGDPKNPL